MVPVLGTVAVKPSSTNPSIWRLVMVIKKRVEDSKEPIYSHRESSDARSSSTKDPEGHPYIGYMDGDVFVPNSTTIDAFNERSQMLAEYRSENDNAILNQRK